MTEPHDEAPGPVSESSLILGQLQGLLGRLEKNLAGSYRLLRHRDRQVRILFEARVKAEKERDEARELYHRSREMLRMQRVEWMRADALREKDYQALLGTIDRVRGVLASRPQRGL